MYFVKHPNHGSRFLVEFCDLILDFLQDDEVHDLLEGLLIGVTSRSSTSRSRRALIFSRSWGSIGFSRLV